MNKNTNISERIIQIVDYLNITINDFAKKIGYNRSQALYDIINGKSKPSFDFFDKLYSSEYSELISSDWLITGNGNMLKEEKSNIYKVDNDISNIIEEPNTSYNNDKIVKLLEDKIVLLEENKAFQQEKILALERCVKCFQEEIKKLNNEIESSKK